MAVPFLKCLLEEINKLLHMTHKLFLGGAILRLAVTVADRLFLTHIATVFCIPVPAITFTVENLGFWVNPNHAGAGEAEDEGGEEGFVTAAGRFGGGEDRI